MGIGEFAKPLMCDETVSLQHHSNHCTAKDFVSRINDIERASYNGSIEASQASDLGSIPIAHSINPDDSVDLTWLSYLNWT